MGCNDWISWGDTFQLRGYNMSGGYINRPDGLKVGEHVLITVAIKGDVKPETCRAWDENMETLKARLGDRAIAITVVGEKTPEKFKKKAAKKKAAKKKAAKK
jgi:hypothetical protein